MKSKALSVIERYQMLKPGATVIVAFSGGADSIALLYFLYTIKDEYNIKIIAAHVNHGIRGKEADRDENFVKDFCKKINVQLKLLHVNVPKLAKENGESEEQCGRRIRYEFFNSIDKNAIIATAHTQSDNIETVLFNLTRGTALKGLCGIPAVRDNIIRPLIDCSREDIEIYCEENNLKFVTDSTNNMTEYSRNKIRHNVIPNLKQINPSLEKSFTRCTESITRDNDYLNEVTSDVINKAAHDSGYDASLIKNQHVALRYRILEKLIYKNCGIHPEQKHIQLANEILFNEGKLEVCEKRYLRVKNEILDFPNFEKKLDFWCVPFDKNTVKTPAGRIETKVIDKNEYEQKKNFSKDVLDIFVDYDKIGKCLYFRSRKECDKFTSGKRKITKTLKKLYNEAKIPIEERNSIVILANSDEIFWIEGFGASEKASVKNDTKKVLELKIWR